MSENKIIGKTLLKKLYNTTFDEISLKQFTRTVKV